MRKLSLPSLITGIIIGALIFSGALAAAAGVTVTPTTAKVLVDGRNVQVAAYNIDGSNYFKLRDFTAAVDIGVWFEQAANTIHIETDKKYDPNYAGPASAVNEYTVTRVVDGDTIEINYNGTTEKLRLIGVDTPESVHPDADRNTEFGRIASKFTEDYLLGQEVELEFDVSERDKYGRLLVYVWHDGTMFNEYLLQQGYAQVSTYPPDVKYVDTFITAQENAREAKLGLWAYADTETSSPANSGTIVYITNSGDKYHLGNCRHLTNSKIEISLEGAKAGGYTPCGTCKPTQ